MQVYPRPVCVALNALAGCTLLQPLVRAISSIVGGPYTKMFSLSLSARTIVQRLPDLFNSPLGNLYATSVLCNCGVRARSRARAQARKHAQTHACTHTEHGWVQASWEVDRGWRPKIVTDERWRGCGGIEGVVWRRDGSGKYPSSYLQSSTTRLTYAWLIWNHLHVPRSTH